MPRVRYSREQMLAMVEEYDGGAKVPDVCRRHGVSERTLYRWLTMRRQFLRLRGTGGEPCSVPATPGRSPLTSTNDRTIL